MSIAKKAYMFAVKAHGDQRYGDFPYSYHLNRVVEITKKNSAEYGESGLAPEYLVAAAWLHDVLEDTDVTFEQLFHEFGRNISRIVFACTDEPGKNRKERHERTYPKLRAAGREAIAIKLADRIANVTHSKEYNHGMFVMYQKEYPDFKKYLFLPGELKELWAELDVLMEHKVEETKK